MEVFLICYFLPFLFLRKYWHKTSAYITNAIETNIIITASGRLTCFPVNQVLEQVGALASSDVYTSITLLVDPPISARTARERRERGNMSTKPLEDTKVMINSISYEVKDLDGTE